MGRADGECVNQGSSVNERSSAGKIHPTTNYFNASPPG